MWGFFLDVCVCILYSGWSLYGLPGLKQTEQKREEPSEGSSEETEEERAMAAQPAGVGEGEKAQFTRIYAASYSLDKSVITAPYSPVK